MSAKLAYIAAPYSDPDPAVIVARMTCFDLAIVELLRTGECFPISPLMNHANVGRHSLPGNWAFWQHYSRRLLGRCDEMIIVKIPGWELSEGVQSEVVFANELSLPISYVGYDRLEYDRVLAETRLSLSQG